MDIFLWHPAIHPLLQLFYAGYIGAADAAQRRDFPLGARRAVIQSISQGNDRALSGCQAGIDTAADPYAGIPGIQLLQHIIVYGDYIH